MLGKGCEAKPRDIHEATYGPLGLGGQSFWWSYCYGWTTLPTKLQPTGSLLWKGAVATVAGMMGDV